MDFEEYEQDFLASIRAATTLIGKSNYADNAGEAQAALGEAQQEVVSARRTFKQMKLSANSNAGLRVQLRHAEVLQHPPYGPYDGNLLPNGPYDLRSAAATDVYILKGDENGESVDFSMSMHG